MFKLLRYFSISSFIAVVLVAALLGMFYRWIALNNLMEMAESRNIALAQAFANSLWPQFAPFVESASGLSSHALRAQPEIAQLRQSVLAQMRGLEVVKVKVYSPSGLTVFSTEAKQIGEDKSTNAGFLSARQGKVASELTHRDTFSAFEQTIEDRDVFSSYIPIRRGPEGPIEGVFELYYDVTSFLRKVKRTQISVILGVTSILAVLYGALYFVVRRADRIIKRQDVALRQYLEQIESAKETLEQRVRDRTKELLAINEQLQAEVRERERTEEKFRRLLEFAPDAMVIVDRDGRILMVNTQAERLFHYTREELLGRQIEILVPERGRSGHLGHRARYLTDPAVRPMGTGLDLSAVRKDGKEFPVEISLSPLESEQQVLISAAIRDITERKLAQEELKKSHEETQQNLDRIRVLHEIDLAITSTLDLRGVLEVLLEKIDLVLPYSVTTVRLLNRDSGRLEPVACRNLDETEWRASINGADNTLSRAVPDIKTPLMIRNAQTDPRSLAPDFLRQHSLVSLLRAPLIAKGEVLGVLTFFTKEEHEFSDDEVEFLVTLAGQTAIAIHNAQLYDKMSRLAGDLAATNRRLETSLKELTSLYTALSPLTPASSINEIFDGIIERLMESTGADAALIRLRDNATGTLPWVSQRGFPDHYLRAVDAVPLGGAANWVFQRREPLIAPDIAADSRLKGKVQIQVGLRSCAILPLQIKNEVQGILHLASRQLGYFTEEQRYRLIAIARQMGIALENRQLFDELKASNVELERSNKVKDEFLSVMSHELRTPLNVVMGYTAMMKDGMLGDVNPKQDDALGKVLDRVNDQLAMINNILFSTAIEASKIPVERQAVILADLFHDLESTYFASTISPDLTLSWDCPPDLPILETDRAKLKQILQNLIDNAIKFTAKGKISISARHNREAKTIELRVADTGLGIPRDMIGAIFEKFRQVDSSQTRPFGGVGMGLYIVKSFTEMLAGKIEVESEAGKGSTFTVTIPC